MSQAPAKPHHFESHPLSLTHSLDLRKNVMSSELIKHVTDTSFESDVLQSALPVLVDFWAPWCGPCQMLGPVLDDLAKVYEGKLQMTKMNVDENRDVPALHNIRGIPTVMIFKSGQLVATRSGFMSKSQLTTFINQALI